MKSTDMDSKVLQEHKEWSEKVKRKLSSISDQLCEIEELLKTEHPEEDAPQLFELLHLIDDIHLHHSTVVNSIEECNKSNMRRRENLELQMESLEKSMNLLKMEPDDRE